LLLITQKALKLLVKSKTRNLNFYKLVDTRENMIRELQERQSANRTR